MFQILLATLAAGAVPVSMMEFAMQFFLRWGMRFLFIAAALWIVAAVFVDMRYLSLTLVCVAFACLFGIARIVFPPSDENYALVVSAE